MNKKGKILKKNDWKWVVSIYGLDEWKKCAQVNSYIDSQKKFWKWLQYGLDGNGMSKMVSMGFLEQ